MLKHRRNYYGHEKEKKNVGWLAECLQKQDEESIILCSAKLC